MTTDEKLDWLLRQGLPYLSAAARSCYNRVGRGALVISKETLERDLSDLVLGFDLDYRAIGRFAADEAIIRRRCEQYDPESQFVIFVVQQEGKWLSVRTITPLETTVEGIPLRGMN